MRENFEIQEMNEVLKMDERITRKLLNDAMTRKLLNDSGADIDELAEDPGERIPREVLINLAADRAGSREGRLLARLLRD